MKSWPPKLPDSRLFIPAFAHLKENVVAELHHKDMSAEDKGLAQYMRTSNIGTRLMREMQGLYRRKFVVAFDTVTPREIDKKGLRVFVQSPDEADVFVVPTDVTHRAVNGLSPEEAQTLADEVVGGYYEQYAIAKTMGISKKELYKISPRRFQKDIRRIHETIRTRALIVLGE